MKKTKAQKFPEEMLEEFPLLKLSNENLVLLAQQIKSVAATERARRLQQQKAEKR